MSQLNVIIGVPQADVDALSELAESLSVESDISRDRYLNGAEFLDLAATLLTTAAVWETLRTWINARAEVAKATRIVVDGVELIAVNPKQAEALLRVIAKQFPRDGDDGQD